MFIKSLVFYMTKCSEVSLDGSWLREFLMKEAEAFFETSYFYSLLTQLISQKDCVATVIYISSIMYLIFIPQFL
jgi:hypothetical protein